MVGQLLPLRLAQLVTASRCSIASSMLQLRGSPTLKFSRFFNRNQGISSYRNTFDASIPSCPSVAPLLRRFSCDGQQAKQHFRIFHATSTIYPSQVSYNGSKPVLFEKASSPVQRQRMLADAKALHTSSEEGQQAEDSETKLQRLCNLLAAAGVASRRACASYVHEGQVMVNGVVATQPGMRIDPAKDEVQLHGHPVELGVPVELFYVAMNKPKGYVCSNADVKGNGMRVLDLLEPFYREWHDLNSSKEKEEAEGAAIQAGGARTPRLFTVGRLDVASSGLIFLTNDGKWAQSLAHPSSGLTKDYLVEVPALPTVSQLAAVRRGTYVDGEPCVPVRVHAVTRQHPGGTDKHWVKVVVAEGRKHEVRELARVAGLEVLKLRRTRVGAFRLPKELRPGQYLLLTPDEAKNVLCNERAASEGFSQRASARDGHNTHRIRKNGNNSNRNRRGGERNENVEDREDNLDDEYAFDGGADFTLEEDGPWAPAKMDTAVHAMRAPPPSRPDTRRIPVPDTWAGGVVIDYEGNSGSSGIQGRRRGNAVPARRNPPVGEGRDRGGPRAGGNLQRDVRPADV